MGDPWPDMELKFKDVSGNSDHPVDKAGLLASEKADEAKVVIKVGPSVSEPNDRYNLVYVILLIHGVGILMPWNMFINANDYFTNYKLKDSPDMNGTKAESAGLYRDYFLSCLGFVAQIPNVLFNGINLFCQFKRGSPAPRIVFSIIVIVIMFILTIALAMIDSSHWPGPFFWMTMVTVVIINVANGIYQNSIYGTAACLPLKYTNAVILGSNISGLVTSIIALVAVAATPDPRTSAIYYFLTAIFILLVAFDSYFALPILPFYKHFERASRCHKHVSAQEETSYLEKYSIVIKKCWVHLLSVFSVFFVTLTCFPAIEAGIARADENFIITEKFFSLVTCFLFFNLFAVVGSLLTEFVRKPGPKYVWIPVLARFVFIPFFMLCNFRPEKRSMPVWFGNDYIYCLGSILMALTSGYFSSLTMMYAPGNVEDKYKGIAGMMGAFCLILGVFGGIIFSFPMIYAIENIGSYKHASPLVGNTSLGLLSVNCSMQEMTTAISSTFPSSGI